jgi:hypothetical protein
MLTTLALFVGLWTTNCTQTQTSTNFGFARDSYKISASGEYEYTRQWYVDAVCAAEKDSESEIGSIELGKKISGIFVTGDTFEANFSGPAGTDLGALATTGRSLKVARGMKNSTFRNTMVGFIEFIKQ